MIIPNFQVCAYWNLNNPISLLEKTVPSSGWPKASQMCWFSGSRRGATFQTIPHCKQQKETAFQLSDWHCFSLLLPEIQKAIGKGCSPHHSTSLPFYSKTTSRAVSAMWEQLLDHSHTCDSAGITERRGRGFKKKLTEYSY